MRRFPAFDAARSTPMWEHTTVSLRIVSMINQEGDSAASLGPYSPTALTRNGGFVRSASFHEFVDADLRLPSR